MTNFSTEKLQPPRTETVITLADAWSVLESTGWLAKRSEATRKRLRSIATLRSYDPGEFICHSGAKANGIYALVSGGLDVSIPRVDNEEFVVHRADIGFWAGELGLFSGQPRLISLRATVPSQLVVLKKPGLMHLIESHPELLRDFYELSHREMELALQLLGNLVVVGAENRVALRLLILHAALPPGSGLIAISQVRLAAFTAISQQTLRRVLRTLETRGLIETGYNKIRVLDLEGLRAVLSQ